MKITVSQDRMLFAATGGSQRYARVQFTAPAVRHAERPPLSVGIVLDRSGSMAGPKLELARAAAVRCLGFLQPSDRVSVVVYDTEVETLVAAAPADPATLRDIAARLAAIEAGDCTNLEGGWLLGADAVARAGLRRMRVLLITDGLANVGETHPTALGRHATTLRERGLLTTTLGVGDDFDEVLLRQLAELGGGNFHFVDTPEQFDPILAGELGEALEPYADDLSVHIDAGVPCEVLGERLAYPTATGCVVRVGALSASRTTDVVLRVTPGAAPVGREITVRLAAHWVRAADGARRVEDPQTVSFIAATPHANRAQERDAATIVRVVQLRVADAQRRALECNRDGRYDEARRLIRHERRDLRYLAAGIDDAMRIIDTLPEMERTVSGVMDAGDRIMLMECSTNTQRLRASYRSVKTPA